MTKLEKKLRASLRRLGISEQTVVLVAVSGGADSTALLNALVRLRGRRGSPQRIFAAHLNHLLRGVESEADETFVREMAARCDVPILVEREAIAEHAQAERANLEATARRLRYDFLRRAAQRCGAVALATAHTWDDQVETILMRLLRGSGPAGLRGIHQVVAGEPGLKLIRPLLGVTRAEVLEYCVSYGLGFRTDSSNFSSELTRNRVRHELLPLLRTFNPRFGAALIRTTEQIAEDEDYLSCVAEHLAITDGDGMSLNLGPLRAAHPAIRRRVLRSWLRTARGNLRRIEAVHLAALDRLATCSEGGRYVELPGGWHVTRKAQRLILTQVQDLAVEQAESSPSRQDVIKGSAEARG